MSPEELRLPMPWGHIAAKAWGSPNGKPVLMVHGLLDNAGSFDRLIPFLPFDYYFVCIDLPGHGLSSHFPAGLPLDYLNHVLALRRVLDSLKWSNCIYIGHSLGATMGLMFTSIYPERVKKILCFDAVTATPITNNRLIPHIRKVHDNILSIEGKEKTMKVYTEDEVMYMLMYTRFFALNFAAAEALMKRSVTKIGDKYKLNRDVRLNAGLFPVFNSDQHLSLLEKLKSPATVIAATATMATAHYEKMLWLSSDRLTKSHRFLIVEGNHDVHNNHPEKVASHVCQFLSDLKSNL
ncbi:serine hydrolase-like protein [Neodiprion fabricii]|uniref:serine hydrolase-like protein n=1 Tax=Neodiprion fabricii TaxID=2872261 RepID=UPI001ED964EB|nr:serine hydrolase-like protein [Neodiprion fabricii]XP_046416906.1 serine hydrolase-like protein [Neodiprion fabricii]XP_046416907.1 serine hydrolase-like protein [Neodiprion fabricii]